MSDVAKKWPNGRSDPASDVAIRESVRRVCDIGQRGLAALRGALDGALMDNVAGAVSMIVAAPGRVIVTGMGKSGHIGTKIAATLSSTGTPAYFVHPAEASHGDLGMVTPDDVVLALSWSGETSELASIIAYSRRFKVPLIAVTSNASSALGRASDLCLQLPAVEEACPHGLAPTTSTLVQLALGDCLAIALLDAKGFSALDFKTFHPGGSLGGKLRLVRDVMHTGDWLPLVPEGAKMADALITMSAKGFGCVGVVGLDGGLVGVVTDGDLRRHMGHDLVLATAREIMTHAPKTVAPSALAVAALEIMNSRRITALFVIEGDKPVGIVHVHDLLRAGVA